MRALLSPPTESFSRFMLRPALAQLVSVLLSVVLPGRVPSPQHAYNPLEQTFICLGATAVVPLSVGEQTSLEQRQRLLERFGV